MNELIKRLREFIKEKNAQALLVNSTNEFLVEYNKLDNNSRYLLTGFSGSSGDVLLTLNNVYLFVDGRYHQQADLEVDKSVIKVVKLKLGHSYLKELVKRVPEHSTLLTVPSKNSYSFEKALDAALNEKSSSIIHLEQDVVPVFLDKQAKKMTGDAHIVPALISGLTADEKFEQVSSSLKEKEAILITTIEDVAYLTNLRAFDIPYCSSFFGKVVITNEKAYIFSDYNIPKIGIHYEAKAFQEFDTFLSNLKRYKIYLNEKSISAKDYYLIDSTNSLENSDFHKLKTSKNDSEIEHIKTAFSRTDRALAIIKDMIDSDKIYSELDFSNALEENFYKNGAKSLSFKPIVAAGKNSSIIHYSHSSKDVFIKDGDFLLVDCGGYYEGGYATDITRTFIKGKPSNKQKHIYTTVLKAFLNAYFHSYSVKSTWFDIDKVARNVIEKQNNAGFDFAHSTGHGVGICVHESPPYVSTSELSKNPILNNTVFTIEPGIYKKNWGGVRLENTVLSRIIGDKVSLESFSKFEFEEKLVDYNLLTKNETKWLKQWQES